MLRRIVSTRLLRGLFVVLVLGIIAVSLWRFYPASRSVIGVLAMLVIAIYLLAEFLEPFVWLGGLMRGKPAIRRSGQPRREE